MEKYNEDLLSMGQDRKATPDEVAAGKETAIKAMLNQENINLDDLSDEELDELLIQAAEMSTMEEKINNIIDCVSLAGGKAIDIKEALHVHTGMKLEEAEDILRDKKIYG